MNLIAKAPSLPPLIQTHAKVIERGAIGIERASIRPKYSEVLRREVQHLTEFHFLLPDLFFGPLLVAQIENERDALVATFLEQRGTSKHRNGHAIFPDKFLLVWLNSPGCLQFCQGAFVALAPLRRRQIGPARSARDEIVTAVSQHAQKGSVGFDDRTFEVPDEDPQNVGVDQAPDLSFAIFEIAIELRILERDCRLRRKHLQHCDAVRSENVWRQIVFKVENTDELGLVN